MLLSKIRCWVLRMLGTADAEILVLLVENPELTYVLQLNPGVGQDAAMHAPPLSAVSSVSHTQS